jgi:hypothetical protein
LTILFIINSLDSGWAISAGINTELHISGVAEQQIDDDEIATLWSTRLSFPSILRGPWPTRD